MSRIADQIFAAQELESIYTEWKINPDYPQDIWTEFRKVMDLLSAFVKD